MTIYKWLLQSSPPKNAIVFGIACASFVIGLVWPSHHRRRLPTSHPAHPREHRPIRQPLRPNGRASNRGLSGIDIYLIDDHFNVGQKRLLFLARAMVRAGSILILAEGQPASIGRPSADTENQPRGFRRQREHHRCASDYRDLGYGPSGCHLRKEAVELLLARDPPSLFRDCTMRSLYNWPDSVYIVPFSTTTDRVIASASGQISVSRE
ncbi:uncharacterized protein NFIA_032630 [Aspergillus fischeri NRRL 181]|uniref:Uncharacterized protein n=1 Tax=Neosartorya fischeri (strain ATCC 1020 / DSM 3700 / CBS 544.65 / FGSC A1164 / JCM 1740 / NRRL 181 / WB 181) TaxID=331117 RepID=A1CY78_NEOFI|nr:uncharacterized protein NFIA_032630 [Aspergillus fischeri NRRL 181]EAW23698.1 hypothetical protein NFIA_032630 [Aspergillus fischeri NRRL 181]